MLTPELGSEEKDVDKDKDGKNVSKLESVEVEVSSLQSSDCQHTSKVLFTFVPNKQFGKLINISSHSLTMINTVNTEFSSAERWFTDQTSKALEDNVNLTLIIG